MTVTAETRRQSYAQVSAELGPRQREVVQRLTLGPKTAWEIAEETRRLVHSVRPRLHELAQAGLVREVGHKFRAETGRNEALWALTSPGQLDLL